MNADANPQKHFQDAHRWLARVAGAFCCAGWLIAAHAQDAAKPDTPKAAASSTEAKKDKVPPKPKPTPLATFEFGGGSLHDFIKRVNEHFGVDVFERATIELSWYGTRVPKIRVQNLSANYGPVTVCEAYNALAQDGFPSLGRWHWNGGVSNGLPDILTLTRLPSVDGKSVAAFKVRAFSVKRLSEDQREKLARTIYEFRETALRRTMEEGLGSEQDFAGSLSFSRETDLMLAVGSEEYLSLVESVMKEHRNQELERRPPPPADSDSKKP